ncbi:hypothetical protein BZJ17_15860 [Salinivibrio sp. IB574]|nr:hypothetical protein BZJ17_15860 [Salinivibrio sp. IB574]
MRCNAFILTSYQIARKLGRSRASVAQRAMRLGVCLLKAGIDSPKAKYPQEDIDMIRALRDEGLSYYSIARKFEIDKSYIRQICIPDVRLYDDSYTYHLARLRQVSGIDCQN